MCDAREPQATQAPQGHKDEAESVTPSAPLPLSVRLISAPVYFYRRYISPLTPPSCRFTPTCSQYALDAFRHWGALKGSWLTAVRLLKCQPFHPGGYDPVTPPNGTVKSPHEKNNEKNKT